MLQDAFPHNRFISTEEKLVWYGLVYTYPLFMLGALYVSGSVLGWLIIGVLGLRFYILGKPCSAKLPLLVWLWIAGMLVMLLALLIAHGNWSLGTGKTIKSSIGWAKGWALLAVFPIIGALAAVRSEVVVRAVCVVAVHTLIFAIISYMAYLVRLPGDIYLSPLKVVGGPGETFFMVSLYGLNPETGAGRWRFFGPWAPAAGLLACIYLIFCLHEKHPKWRNWGVAGCFAMILLSQSRAGLAIFIMLFPMVLFADKLKQPWFLLAAGVLLPAMLLLSEPIYTWLMDSYEQVKQQRPGSTRVRQALANIALQRWQAEAPIWGHGIVERGPAIVEGMPIGSHHSWYGLLFVKGVVGVVALAVPMLLTSIYLIWQTQFNDTARMALCMMAVFICYSFFENLEILSYLYWPAMLIVGMAMKTQPLPDSAENENDDFG